MSPLTREFDLLRRCARQRLHADEPVLIEHCRDVNWAHLLWLGHRQGLLLFLRAALRGPTLRPACPPEVLAQLDELAAAMQIQALARTGEVRRLHDAFEAEGVPLVLVDDWMFQHSFASSTWLTEKLGEIRCLVATADLGRAARCAAQAGNTVTDTSFVVTTRDRSPVRLIDASTMGVDPRGCDEGRVPVGGRPLRRLPRSAWLTMFAELRPEAHFIDLYRAWQLCVLTRDDRPALQAEGNIAETVSQARRTLELEVGEAHPPSLPPQQVTAPLRPPPHAPFVGTPADIAMRLLALAEPTAEDLVYDLGCGDGNVLIQAAKHFGAKALGVDTDPSLIAKARERAVAEGVADRATFVTADLFTVDLQPATVICAYLLPACYEPLQRRIATTARAGVRVLSRDYSFPQWPPDKTEIVRYGPADASHLYLWRLQSNEPPA